MCTREHVALTSLRLLFSCFAATRNELGNGFPGEGLSANATGWKTRVRAFGNLEIDKTDRKKSWNCQHEKTRNHAEINERVMFQTSGWKKDEPIASIGWGKWLSDRGMHRGALHEFEASQGFCDVKSSEARRNIPSNFLHLLTVATMLPASPWHPVW